jgi:hypothetical protein
MSERIVWKEERPGYWECWSEGLEIADIAGEYVAYAQGQGIIARATTLAAAKRKAEKWSREDDRRREEKERLDREFVDAVLNETDEES